MNSQLNAYSTAFCTILKFYLSMITVKVCLHIMLCCMPQINVTNPYPHQGEDHVADYRQGAQPGSGQSAYPSLLFCNACCSVSVSAEQCNGHAQVRVHTREGTLKPLTDVALEREGAQWPPRLTSAERADIMRPEALRSERQLLLGGAPGARRRHLLVSLQMPCVALPGDKAEARQMCVCPGLLRSDLDESRN